jgi:hypothetical protein
MLNSPEKLRWVQLFCDILTPKIVQHHDGMADALRIKGTGLGMDRICLTRAESIPQSLPKSCETVEKLGDAVEFSSW